jgi:membrane protein
MLKVLRLFTRAFGLWIRKEADQHAAALAYFTPFALTPLIIFSITLTGVIVGSEHVTSMLLRWGNAIDPGVTDLLYNSVQNFDLLAGQFVFSLIGVLFITIMIFVTLNSFAAGLHKMWDVEVGGFRQYLKRMMKIALTIGLLEAYLVLFIFLSASLSIAGNFVEVLALPYVKMFVGFVSTVFLISIVYGLLTIKSPSFQARSAGAIIASVLLLFTRQLVEIHFATAPVQSLFGAAGLLISLLVWVYVAAGILLYGAAFARVYEEDV